MTKVWFIILSMYMSDGTLSHKVFTSPSPQLNNQLDCEAQADSYQEQLRNAPEVVKVRADCDYMDVSRSLGQIASE